MNQELKLHSPAGSDPIFYKWPLVITNTRDEAAEITESIRWVCEDFPELSFAFQNIIMKEYDPECYESMSQLCNRYNKAIDGILQLWKGRAPPPKMFKRPGRHLLRHIINVCYNHAVTDPEKLNIYEPFSPEVYGETSFDMVSQMIDEVNFGLDDTFMDLGSGVGQVVLQVAASVQCKECYGIEKAETPVQFAVAMEKEFKRWMAWFGKTYSPFKLEKGDFLREETGKRIAETSIIFVNNFAFGPKVNHQLKIRFQGLKEGAKVVSSREYCPINFKFNSRNLSELGAMMRVTEIKPRNQAASVSWTGKGVSYYLHVVDRTRLEKYFSILKKKKQGLPLDDDERSICSESNNSSMFESAVDGEHDAEKLEDNLDALYLGATTRHQWQVLVSTLQASKKEHAEKEALDKEERHREASAKKGKKFIKGAKPQNLQGKLKKKIMEKYEKQKRIKEIWKENSSTTKRNRGRPLKKKSNSEFTKHREKKKSLDESKISRDLDHYFASMKSRYMRFIRKMNSKAYADKIKQMIEYEMVRKRLLQRQVLETDFEVKNLLRNGLQLFTKRISEAGMAVKTPQDLLNKSKALSAKHQQLKDQVISMETQVYLLEEKYKSLNEKREQQLIFRDLRDYDDLGIIPSTDENLPNKLCSAIIASLNHRKNLLQEYKDVKEQVKVLEKVVDPADAKRKPSDQETEKPSVKKKKHNDEDRKQKPVALVPPRMLGNNGTVSPMLSESKRRKQRKKSKRSCSPLGNCSESLIHERAKQFFPRYSYPPDPSMFYNHEPPWIEQQRLPFCSGEHSYSMYQSSEPFAQNWLSQDRGQNPRNKNKDARPKFPTPPSQLRDEGVNDYYQSNHSFLDATRNLLSFNDQATSRDNRDMITRRETGERVDIINSNFPVNISSEQPFWQQYSNLAKAASGKSKTDLKRSIDARLSDNSSTETASFSSQEESPMRGSPNDRPMSSDPRKATETSSYVFPRNLLGPETNINSMSNQNSPIASAPISISTPPSLSISSLQPRVFKSEPGHFPTASQSDAKKISNAYSVSKLISSQAPAMKFHNSVIRSETFLKDHAKSTKKASGNQKNTSNARQNTQSPLVRVTSSSIDNIALSQLGMHIASQTTPIIAPLAPCTSSQALIQSKYLTESSAANKFTNHGKTLIKTEIPTSVLNSVNIQPKVEQNTISSSTKMNPLTPYSAIRIPELNTNKPNKPIVQSMKIYKPGSASLSAAGKKSKQSKKSTGSLPKRTSLMTTTTTLASNMYPTVIPGRAENVVYRNPIMTILPSHSRLLVVPNVSNTPSITASPASYSAVFYINSASAAKTYTPLAASNVSSGSQQTIIASTVSTASASASTSVVSNVQSSATQS